MARPKATLALSGLITPWSTMAHLLPRLPKPRLGALRAYSTQLSNAVPLVIHGTYQSSSDGSTFTVTNPRTLSPIGTSAAASSADCLSAIRSADAAYAAWEATPPTARRDIFLRAADVLAQPAWRERVLETMHAETDASEFWVDFNWKGAVGALRTTAGLVNELAGRAYKSAIVPGAQVLEQKRAMGVIFTISPWNAPIVLSVRALAIPLFCGNGVVFKPSENSPRSQAIVVDALHEAGLPHGVLNYVPIAKDDAPARCAEIIAHPAVKKITFTGSARVGRALAMEAAKHLKPCVLELGGKSPAIVLEDADIEHAARTIVFGALANSGQVCMSTERVIVVRSIAPRLLSAIRSLLSSGAPAVRAGDEGRLGALFNEDVAKRLVGMLDSAKEGGAKIVFGEGKREGAVVQPHLLTSVKEGMELWEEEQFGPVISVMEVADEEEAIKAANANQYSLTAAVFTRNASTAVRLAEGVRASCVSVNGSTFHAEPTNTEIGLSGASGYGRFDVDSFTDRRTIVLHPDKQEYPFFE